MSYTISKNQQFNSLEITFDSKPADTIREALKALKFRWHSVKKCWYGYTDEGTARAAIEGKENTPEVSADYHTTASDGYMGAIEYTGSKYAGSRLYGKELSSAIREAFKECKIGGVTVSVHSYSGGQDITVKVKALASDIIDRETFIKGFSIISHSFVWLKNLDGSDIHRDYLPWDDSDKMEEIRAYNAAYTYDTAKKEIGSEYGHDLHNMPDGFFTESFNKKIAAIKKILAAFNHDDSNSQVDYFDRHFYENIRIFG